MKFVRKFLIAPLAMIALIVGLSPLSFAKPKENVFANIRIENFGKMDERFYRGGRPKPEDLKNLAALGIKTIID